MFKSLGNILKACNLKSLSCITQTHQINFQQQFVRTLFSQQSLGIDNFLNTRDKIRSQFAGMDVKFKNKMLEYINSEDKKNLIFTEDLKNMIYLSDPKDEDIDLLMKMTKKFNSQNKDLRFGNFIFGPVLMRMFHALNKPVEAVMSFTDIEMESFYDQVISYQILLDLLYENGKYDEVVKMYEIIKSKQIQGSKYPKNVVLLAMAALYKQNTKTSYEYGKNVWKDLAQVGHKPMRRSVTFLAALALKQNEPSVSLEIISGTANSNYVTIRNLKVLGLCKIGRLEDALAVLKNALKDDSADVSKKQTFFNEVLEEVKKAFQACSDEELKSEFEKVAKYLTEQGHVTDQTLDGQLCSEIQAIDKMSNFSSRNYGMQRNYQNNNQRNQYNQSNFRQKNFTYRPSLTEMQ